MAVGQMSVGQMLVDQMLVGQKICKTSVFACQSSIGQLSVGQIVFDQKSRNQSKPSGEKCLDKNLRIYLSWLNCAVRYKTYNHIDMIS
jgi:hypothetical protein